jgi:hypothetical protein
MIDIIGTLVTTPQRPLATSALPDAPVVDNDHRWAERAHRVIDTLKRVIAAAPGPAPATPRTPMPRASR